jgi:hypothetical protein
MIPSAREGCVQNMKDVVAISIGDKLMVV